jgi:penicillin G amidase
VRRALLVLGLLAVVAAAAAGAAVWRTFPRRQGTLRVSGHGAPIRIETDARGVPAIHASSIPDAMFGLGYVHARDRLWQMEFQRRTGSGRLAEILGERLVPADRFLRTVGFGRAANAARAVLSRETRGLLEAYARGVNAYLAADPARPVEFRLLRVSPEPWTPVDSLVWGKMMAWDLAANARDEIRRAGLVEALGAEKAAELLPLAGSAPTILAAENWEAPAAAKSRVSCLGSEVDWGRADRGFDALGWLGLGAGESLGSNSWVLAGSRTVSGRPVLANDPHLKLRAPSTWYLAALDAPGLRAAGATLPGVPGIIIGHNDRIAWALTSLEPDVQDLFVEEVDPNDSSRYRHRGAWKPFAVRSETIRVRGGRDVSLTVRESVHGPIVTDALTGAERLGSAVALRWTGLDEDDRTGEAFLAIDRARGWEEFLAAARLLRVPAQNLLYADVEGHIGYTASGAMPIRPRGDGLLPVSGAGEDDWTGTVPFDELPRVLDPRRGFLVAANNRVVPSEPYPFGLHWAEPYRARRITQRIEEKPRLSGADVAAIQLDRRSLQAEDLVPLILDTAPADAASRDALARLSAWNRDMDPDSPGAAIYAAWFVELARMPEDELAVRNLPRRRTRSRFLVNALRASSAWCDDVSTPRVETCADFKTSSLRDAVAFLRRRLGADASRWRWRDLHRARMAHDVFAGVPLLRRLFDLEAGHGGDGSTVDVGSFSQDGAFAMTEGASYRQVVDLADPWRARFVTTTGQSGNVFDRRYRDLLPLWGAGESFPLEAGRAAETLTLAPP